MENDTATYIRQQRSIIKDQEKKQKIQLINTYNVSLRPHLPPADITIQQMYSSSSNVSSHPSMLLKPLRIFTITASAMFACTCSYMCINIPTVSEQVRQLRESQKRKNEKAQSQKNKFNGTRFMNICLVMCKTSTYTVQSCVKCLDLILNNRCH